MSLRWNPDDPAAFDDGVYSVFDYEADTPHDFDDLAGLLARLDANEGSYADHIKDLRHLASAMNWGVSLEGRLMGAFLDVAPVVARPEHGGHVASHFGHDSHLMTQRGVPSMWWLGPCARRSRNDRLVARVACAGVDQFQSPVP